MKQYTVNGMTCAACAARVEKAVSKVPGVDSCSVSLLTNSMGVEGEASERAVIAAVTDAGYGAELKGCKASVSLGNDDVLADHETPRLKKRLIASVAVLIVLMYFSMGHMMWNWPVPAFFHENHVAMGILQMLLAGIIMVINQKYFISGFKAAIHLSPNMDTLVAMGSSVSYLYSIWALFAMSGAQVAGGSDAAAVYMHEFYFETAAMILTLITVGKMLESRSKGKTTDALKSLMKLAPKNATVIKNGIEEVVPVEKVNKGDIFVVRPGENIPVDGVVLEGSSAVNEATLTGESIPVDKETGDNVSAATINQSGFIRCQATRVGEDTTISQIIQMVSDAAATKAPIAKIADKVSGVFVPVVISIALITFIGWLIAGENVGSALSYGIAVLVISCPCALGLATPVAIMVGNGMGAKNGMMFKTASSLEETGKIDIVVLDKTGTITSGEPKVTDIICADGLGKNDLLENAYSIEMLSEHPLAKAVTGYVKDNKRDIFNKKYNITEFQALAGNGLSGINGEDKITGGSLKFMSNTVNVPKEMDKKAQELAEQGKTPLLFAKNDKLLGIIAVADVIKEESGQAVKELHDMGVRVVMLTGDNERTAKAIGRQAGVDEVIAGVLPDGKEAVIRKLKESGKVAMVGDGINDAPALTRADIGIAIGAGTDIAIDAADIVLMKSRLTDVSAAIRLSRATLRNIHENLFWAFFYNIIGIPLAAGVWISLFGWTLNPMFGAAAMSLSSFCVVTNALRLNLFKVYDASHDRKRVKKHDNNKNSKGEKNMEKTLNIEGMMCGHCEARVKKALEALAQVDEAVVSHESGTAVVKLNVDVDNAVLKEAVEAQDYKVTGIN